MQLLLRLQETWRRISSGPSPSTEGRPTSFSLSLSSPLSLSLSLSERERGEELLALLLFVQSVSGDGGCWAHQRWQNTHQKQSGEHYLSLP
jgi:hypothetical protein